MKILLTSILILSLAFPQMLIADDECNFDQKNQIEVLRKLQTEYENSRLSENERTLTIERGNSTIHFQRGGCEHLGISIRYHTKDNRNFDDQDTLFDQAGKLIEEFGREFINIDEFRNLIKNKEFKLIQGKNTRIYVIHYKSLTNFEIIASEKDGYRIITVSYYL